jgi:hypothetical protein
VAAAHRERAGPVLAVLAEHGHHLLVGRELRVTIRNTG